MTSVQGQKKYKILVVDDEADLLEIMSMRLDMEGFETLTAISAQAGQVMLKQHPDIDVVISDIRMPGENGIELLTKIRQNDSRKPILFFLTGSLNLPLEQAFSLGAEGVFRKPAHFGNLVAAIRSAILRSQDFHRSRTHVRLSADMQVHLRFQSRPDYCKTLRLSNLGRGGMFVSLESGRLPLLGDMLEFEFTFPGDFLPAILGEGRVVWVREAESKEVQRGFGVEFVAINRQMDHNLLALLNSLIVKSYIPHGDK